MKANLGTSRLPKSFFPFSLDSSTTINFGEVVPIFCHSVVPGSSVNIDPRCAVRLAPMSKPTFAEVYQKTYFYYYRNKDIYPPFDNLLSQTPYTNSSGTTYIPKSVPNVHLSLLWALVLSNCEYSLYTVPTVNINKSYSDSGLSVLSEEMTLLPYVPQTTPIIDFDRTLKAIVQGNFMSSVSDNIRFSSVNSQGRYISGTYVPHVFDNGIQIKGVTPVSADYSFATSNVYEIVDDSVKRITPPTNYSFMLCCRLTDSGKLLRKILLGLGYQIINVDKMVSIMPILAFHKAYFEAFAPKRFIKYDQTYIGRALHTMIDNGTSFETVLFKNQVFDGRVSFLSGFIDDLCGCYYTQDVDYYTSQIIGQLNNYGDTPLAPHYMTTSASSAINDGGGANVSTGTPPSLVPQGDAVTLSQSSLNVLSRYTQMLNRRSLMGGKIADFLKSVFNISKDREERNYIGASTMNVGISDVFSTSETTEGYLGEYAGKAMGFKGLDNLSINCDEHGFVFGFCTIVPRTQHVNGINPCLFQFAQNDFYNEMYDGLTYLPTSVLSFCAIDTPFANFNKLLPSKSFGNLPAYSELKMKTQGILNGDLSMNSTKASYDSFTMDQVFEHYVVRKTNEESDPLGTDSVYQFVWPNAAIFSASTIWRFIGRYLWNGRFDRIFVQNRLDDSDFYDYYQYPYDSYRNDYRTDDNIVAHYVLNLKVNSPMLPIGNSFMTEDLANIADKSGYRADIQ